MNARLKKALCLLIGVMLLMTMLPGCSKKDDAKGSEDTAVTDSQSTDSQSTDSQSTGGQQIGTDPNTGQAIESVDISGLGGNGADVDLSKLSSTMIYSVVYDMMVHPDTYMGKMIRMTGNMASYHDEDTGKTYYACLIEDATACCSQGIEFQTTDEFEPADYPADGKPVTVLGTFDLYSENGNQYCVLKDAVLE